MLTIGSLFPEFELQAVVKDAGADSFATVRHDSYKGKWKLYFFWPKDFTFICPTEIAAFGQLEPEFRERGAQILGGSIDSEFVHLAWRQQHPDLKDLPFPMLSDLKRELGEALGILDVNEGVHLRASFLVDPENIIRHVSVNDLDVGRNPAELLRNLDALQCGGLAPCNWTRGEKMLVGLS